MYDLIIIGAGPAGIAAAIYAARYGLKTVLISKIFGGEVINSSEMGNYPGFPKISGAEIVSKWKEHVQSLEIELIEGKEVKLVKKDIDHFVIKFDNEEKSAKTILFALGLERRKLNVPGEAELARKGVNYCITCDGFLYKGKDIAIIGGGDAGVSGAVFMAPIANKINLIEATPKLSAEKIWLEKLKKFDNVEILLNNKVKEIKGEGKVEGIVLENENGETKEFSLDGIFIEIGSAPSSLLVKPLGIETDEKGFIKVDAGQATNIKGLFAAGDTTTNSNFFWQVLTAMSEGAIAANSINKYLKGN